MSWRLGAMNVAGGIMSGLWVYILYSPSLDRYYTGFSSSPDLRLNQHHCARHGWTSRTADWQTVYRENCLSEGDARRLENNVKARGARRYLQDLKISGQPPLLG